MKFHTTVKTRDGRTAHVADDCEPCSVGHHDGCVKDWFVSAPPRLASYDLPGPALYRCRCYAFGRCAAKQPPRLWRWFGWLRKQRTWEV